MIKDYIVSLNGILKGCSQNQGAPGKESSLIWFEVDGKRPWVGSEAEESLTHCVNAFLATQYI